MTSKKCCFEKKRCFGDIKVAPVSITMALTVTSGSAKEIEIKENAKVPNQGLVFCKCNFTDYDQSHLPVYLPKEPPFQERIPHLWDPATFQEQGW